MQFHDGYLADSFLALIGLGVVLASIAAATMMLIHRARRNRHVAVKVPKHNPRRF